MRKQLIVLFLAVLVGDSTHDYIPYYDIQIVDAASEIEGKEDLMGRAAYLQMLTADPSTGIIPPNIRKAELLFNEQIVAQTQRQRTQALAIQSAGPINVGGRTRAVAFDVRDENIIIAGGVSGGIWKSLDGGDSWVRKSNPENRNSVTCIVQDTRSGREDTWYHGTGEIVGNSARGGAAPFRGDGIYKSTDNGETWSPIASTQDVNPHIFNSQFQYIWDIEINPENLVEDEVLVAAYGGILRSLDGGENWQVEIGQELFNLDESVNLNETNASFYTSLERSANNVFYATLSSESASDERSPDAGIYYSSNGDNWIDITPLTSESKFRRTVIGTSPSNPDITYFMIDSSPIFILEHDLSLINSPQRINGFDAEPRVVPEFDTELGDLNTQGSYNMMIRVHPNEPNTVFIGGTNLFRSTDAFRTAESIEWIGGYNPEGGSSVYPNHHPDQHDLIFLPSNPNEAISASDGGLIRSNNVVADSVIWESINIGFITSQFFTIAQSKVVGDESLIGGMQDNGTDLSINGNTFWGGVIGGDGGYAATTKDNTLWFASFQRGQTLRLTLNDEFELTSFARVDPGGLVQDAGSLYLFVNPFTLDPTNQNRMFCAGGNHLYYHPNVSQIPGGSQTPTFIGWEKVNTTPLTSGLVSAVEISLNGERVFFGTTGGEIYRLDNADDQASFSLSNITSIEFPEGGYVSSIAVNPDDEEHLLVVFSNYSIPSVFESMDGGVTFTDISGNLEENDDGSGSGPSIRWAEIIPKNSGVLRLVGTSIGLFSAEITSSTTTWVKEAPAVVGSSIVTMMDYRPEDGRLAIATHGNGIYTTNVSDFKSLLAAGEQSPFAVQAAYPNPFVESARIQYTLPEDGDVRVDILSPGGILINTILWGPQFAGANSVVWDGANSSGTTLANGVYFYRILYNGQSQSGRLVLRR